MSKTILLCLTLFFNLTSKSQVRDIVKAEFFEDSAWNLYQKRYFRKSITLLDSAIFYDPTNSFPLKIKAEAQWFLGNYVDAAETYKKIILLDNENLLKVSAYVFSGMLYGKAGMTTKAKEQYISAVKLWESGYVPHEQFRLVEELDYFLALAFLEKKVKAIKIIRELSIDSLNHPKRLAMENQNKKYLSFFEMSPRELLEEHFKEFMLPDDIKPLEE